MGKSIQDGPTGHCVTEVSDIQGEPPEETYAGIGEFELLPTLDIGIQHQDINHPTIPIPHPVVQKTPLSTPDQLLSELASQPSFHMKAWVENLSEKNTQQSNKETPEAAKNPRRAQKIPVIKQSIVTIGRRTREATSTETFEYTYQRRNTRRKSRTRQFNLFGKLLTWMSDNAKFLPNLFFTWVLGDEVGWRQLMLLTNHVVLLDYTLESLHRTVAPLLEGLKKPHQWKSPISIDDFKWFAFFYSNRHNLKQYLRPSHPFHELLIRFRVNALQTTLQQVQTIQIERKVQNRTLEIHRRQLSPDHLQHYVGKIMKGSHLKVPTSVSVESFDFVEPPPDIEHIPDGVSFIVRDLDCPDMIIGGRIAGAIPDALSRSLKKMMLQVMNAKPTVQRGTMRRAFCSNMVSAGATKNQVKGSSGEINFVVSKTTKRCKIPNDHHCANTDTLLYKYGFTLLQEIIILVFLRHFLEGILAFLRSTCSDSNPPYMEQLKSGSGTCYGPLMWSLHVTMNYINCIHIDTKDRSEWSLAIVSNTNNENKGGDFFLLSHGISFRQCHNDLFWFCGKKLHGTGFRELPKEHVLIAALVINSAVANIYNSICLEK